MCWIEMCVDDDGCVSAFEGLMKTWVPNERRGVTAFKTLMERCVVNDDRRWVLPGARMCKEAVILNAKPFVEGGGRGSSPSLRQSASVSELGR